jgi:hypothetical protein
VSLGEHTDKTKPRGNETWAAERQPLSMSFPILSHVAQALSSLVTSLLCRMGQLKGDRDDA